MELEGLIRAIEYIEREGLNWSDLVSDRHLQISKWMRENQPGKDHWNDTWHVAKGKQNKFQRSSSKNVQNDLEIMFVILILNTNSYNYKLVRTISKSDVTLIVGLGKKIENIAKLKDCGILRSWKKSITNHMYWVAITSGGNGDLAEAKWKSLANHIQNIHNGHDDPLYPACQHPPIDQNLRRKCWLQPG